MESDPGLSDEGRQSDSLDVRRARAVGVLGVIDLADHVSVERYEIADRLRTQVSLITPSCAFPWCRRSARDCAGWRYDTLEPGVWLWTDPHGQQFLRNEHGTTDVTASAPHPHGSTLMAQPA